MISTRGIDVERVLSVGPRGRVYRARSPEGPLALKELAFAVAPDAETLERFEREAVYLRALDHPRIPRFLASFSEGEGPARRLYLAQTFLPGENLEDRLAHHFFDEVEARRIASDVLEVLAYLHSRSPCLVHRDIKPSNLMALPGGDHAVVDFGAVCLLGASNKSPSGGAGTFGYMPPEQLMGVADHRSDLYALGVSLARLLSRRPVTDLLEPDLSLAFRPYVNISEPFSEFLARLVAVTPGDRFGSAAEARRVLAKGRAPGTSAPSGRMPSVTQIIPASAEGSAPEYERLDEDLYPGVEWVSSRSDRTWSDGGVAWMVRIAGRCFGLRPGFRYVLGRIPECELRIEETWSQADTVSREHAELEVCPAGLRLRDLGSRNGTRVGGVRLGSKSPVMLLREPVTVRFAKLHAELSPAFLGASGRFGSEDRAPSVAGENERANPGARVLRFHAGRGED